MKLEDAEILARRLMAEHGLTNWEFGFDCRKPGGRRLFPRKLRLGFCSFGGEYFEHIGRDRYQLSDHKPKISLFAPFVEAADESMVLEVLMHEIAHALAGKGAKHGRAWKEIVVKIGGTPDHICIAAFDQLLPSIAKSIQEEAIKSKSPNSAQGELWNSSS